MDQTPIQILNRIPQIAIVGVGLLGGSIGLALKKAGYRGRRVGIGRRQESLDKALAANCIDLASLASDEAWAFDRQTLVILATPIGTFKDHLASISQHSPADTLITDAGSTKEIVCDWAKQSLKLPGLFVGSHPMAGSEKQGPEHASAQLLTGRPCLLTPDGDTDANALEVVKALWQSVGMRLVYMTAAQHDLAVAAISHLPHALAVLLVLGAENQTGALDIAAGGFRDTTRIASGDVSVWKDIFTTNRRAVIEMIDRFTHELTDLRQRLKAGDDHYLIDHLSKAKTIRDAWAVSPTQGRSLPARPQEQEE